MTVVYEKRQAWKDLVEEAYNFCFPFLQVVI